MAAKVRPISPKDWAGVSKLICWEDGTVNKIRRRTWRVIRWMIRPGINPGGNSVIWPIRGLGLASPQYPGPLMSNLKATGWPIA